MRSPQRLPLGIPAGGLPAGTHIRSSPVGQARIPQELCKAGKAPGSAAPAGATLSDSQETACHEATPTPTRNFYAGNKSTGISCEVVCTLVANFLPPTTPLLSSHKRSLHTGPPQHCSLYVNFPARIRGGAFY